MEELSLAEEYENMSQNTNSKTNTSDESGCVDATDLASKFYYTSAWVSLHHGIQPSVD